MKTVMYFIYALIFLLLGGLFSYAAYQMGDEYRAVWLISGGFIASGLMELMDGIFSIGVYTIQKKKARIIFMGIISVIFGVASIWVYGNPLKSWYGLFVLEIPIGIFLIVSELVGDKDEEEDWSEETEADKAEEKETGAAETGIEDSEAEDYEIEEPPIDFDALYPETEETTE